MIWLLVANPIPYNEGGGLAGHRRCFRTCITQGREVYGMRFSTTLARVLIATGLVAGLILSFFSLDYWAGLFSRNFGMAETIGVLAIGAVFGALLGAGLTPLVSGVEKKLSGMPLGDIFTGALGLIIGLLIAALLGSSLARIPVAGPIISVLGGIVFGYLGLWVATSRRDELASAITSLGAKLGRDARERRREEAAAPGVAAGAVPKVLDTSVIIDGRIADICVTGFLEGPLIIPAFILEELRHIADSGDMLKRNRGRRGLDILNRIQKELNMPVHIYEHDPGAGLDVDDKLIRLAKQLGGKVVTNDYNLNKVAALQGVPVLNVNDLANAVKPVVLPGEEMEVTVIREGKEPGQGVAYLDDGTMIVIDGGRRHMNETIAVTVTSVLQTSAGRMIFARPRGLERAAP